MTLMTQLLLFTNNNVTESMRTIKQNIRPSYLVQTKNKCTQIAESAFMRLETELIKLTVNKLNEKRNERNVSRHSLKSKTRHVNEVLYNR